MDYFNHALAAVSLPATGATEIREDTHPTT
jgi:hypothetical protein